jgi:tRNA(His) guanylyltransferase
MKFVELDARLRIFETAEDFRVLPGIHMVARLDGRSFTRLTREVHKFQAPFDEKFRDWMVATTGHLMDCGFRMIYGHTQSDEISLVFHRDDTTFTRKTRKLNSVLAGEASAKFSLLLGDVASFDCRISQLPTKSDLLDYLRWRAEDAHRNALNAHCYWALRNNGADVKTATEALLGLSTSEKKNFCFPRRRSISTTCLHGRSGAWVCSGNHTRRSAEIPARVRKRKRNAGESKESSSFR